ncbi:efflux RND transporter periplasmic adaptor subunit [Sphingomonas sp. CJ20]
MSRIPRRIWIGLVALVALAGSVWVLWPEKGGAEGPAAGTEQRLVVAYQPFVATLVFAGRIAPGDAVGITAPFDGAVRTLSFAFGNRVAAGDTLLVLDTEEAAEARNVAEAGVLKSAGPARDLANWASGPEVAAARRRLRLAELELARYEREAAESRRLFDKGLIARNEYAGAEQQLTAQRMATAAARDELADTLSRGDAVAVRAAQLELNVAQARLRHAEEEMRAAILRAPVSGVMVRPATVGTLAGAAPIYAGGRVSRGQLIGLIARDGGLSASFEIDEADVNALAVGQAVTVTGPGFPGLALSGRVASIAADTAEAGTAGKTRFVATATLDAPPAGQAGRVRVGMTAAVAVVTGQKPRAIVLPPLAVEGSAPATTVRVRVGTATEQRAVQVGQATPAGIEIISGLTPGETVVWNAPPPPAQPGSQ